MKRNIIENLTKIVLVIFIVIDAFMLIRIGFLLKNTDAILRENKTSYILPEGFTPAKTRITWNDSPPPSGWVVRYARNGCIYCSLDFDWERLVSQLERLNYHTVLLLPKETNKLDEDQIFPKTAQQMAFVRMDWIKQFRFTGTPTVVIFDNNGHVLWRHRGMLKNKDFNEAEKVLLKML